MFSHKIAVVALSALTLVSAVSNFTLPNPSVVSPDTRSSWCTAQTNSCDFVCGKPANIAAVNSCNPDTLAWTCTCPDGKSPSLDEYTDTIPYFVCQQLYEDCINNSNQNKRVQDGCKSNIQEKCGTKKPDANVATTTTPSTPTATMTPTGGATSTPTSTTTPSGAMPGLCRGQPLVNAVSAAAVGLVAYLL